MDNRGSWERVCSAGFSLFFRDVMPAVGPGGSSLKAGLGRLALG